MSCLHCSSFDPNYHGGYCDYHKCDTSPSSSCSAEDSKGSRYGTDRRCCQTCRSYDGRFCDYYKERMNPTDVCGSWG